MNASLIVDFSPRLVRFVLKIGHPRAVLRRSREDSQHQEMSDDTATSQKYRDTSVPRYFATISALDNFFFKNIQQYSKKKKILARYTHRRSKHS